MRIAIVVFVFVIAALIALIIRDRLELGALRRSHEVRAQFCRYYRGRVGGMRTALRDQPDLPPRYRETARETGMLFYYMLAQKDFFELCQIAAFELEPEYSAVRDCIGGDDYYSCLERAAAKLEWAIPWTHGHDLELR